MLNELFTTDKAMGRLLRKRPTGWKQDRLTEDVRMRLSGRERGRRWRECWEGPGKEAGGLSAI